MRHRLNRRSIAVALGLLALGSRATVAQRQGATELQGLVRGLTVTPRVLVIGAHPDDDDSELIAWLARGRQVETAYLSLTRGEAGEDFVGNGGAVSLGATRTAELLAARRMDGGRSFFTRAFDFGYSRTAEEAFKHWDHDSLLADVITVVRSFRPQVLIAMFPDSVTDGNGQHAVASLVAREALAAAGDTLRCSVKKCGAPWTPLKLYHRREVPPVPADEYDPLAGRTYADLALDARAQHRSEGLLNLFPPLPERIPSAAVKLPGIASMAASTAPAHVPSIFDDVDSSFTRLAAGASAEIARALTGFAALADSARAGLDVAHPALVVEQLARAAKLADYVRGAATWCKHPAADAVMPALSLNAQFTGPRATGPCDQRALDLDASVDLLQRRTHDALLAAAGVSIVASAGRELVAETSRILVAVDVSNHGTTPVTLHDVIVTGAPDFERTPMVVPPDSTVRVVELATGLGQARPWWVGTASRPHDAYAAVESSIDGVQLAATTLTMVTVPGIAVPEEIRRTSDVKVTLTVAGATITVGAIPIVYHSATPALGVQDRPVGAVPVVTLALAHSLEWIKADKPIERTLRLTVRSYSDETQTISLAVARAPEGVHVESLPPTVTLAPRQQREVLVYLRGTLAADRYEFGIVAYTASRQRLFEGFDTFEFPHIPPVRYYRSSGAYLQALHVDVPPRLVVGYVRGVGDAGEDALRQLGVPGQALTPDELAQVDLSELTTIVIGSRAYELHPELAGQNARLLDFARNGGTVVVINGQRNPRAQALFPYPAAVARPYPEHVSAADAPVTVLDPKARVLTWPNRIAAEDWGDWVRERALFVPTTADARYAQPIETHDSGQKENRNTILVTPLGKGAYVYTTLAFYDQIPAGVPGSLRLFVNLLSAGCKPATVGVATGRC